MKIKSILFTIALAVTCSVIFNSCTKENAAGADSASTGQGGSLARFTISKDHLYAVDNHYLYAFGLSDPALPKKVFSSQLNFDIETIYAYGNNLFLGTRTGLYIYSIDTASNPRLIGEARHARSCDPVVANSSNAFVTLKGSSSCGPAVSGLYIHDITTITKPVLIKTVELPDPVGLGLKDSILYVCCGTAGLKVFNVKDPSLPSLISTKNDGDFVDVIPYNGTLICYVRDGVLLYDITNPAAPAFVKKIAG